MYVFPFIAALQLIRRLQRLLKNTTLYPKWSNMLRVALWILVLVFVGIELWIKNQVGYLLSSLMLLGIVSYIKNEPDFKPIWPFANIHLPLIAVCFISGAVALITPGFYSEWQNYFQVAVLGTFLWIFARSAAFKKQEEELKIVAGQKYELERLVTERTAELSRQKNELQDALSELKTMQAQLIQSEKLASLGELTAGIAHEIQNPLNFVNNFSDVSIELVAEMEEELAKGDTEEAIAIATDIKQNLEKIRHHGQRADGIVKGMLQHSRASSNVKEPTDINKLADEYLRLAYHGLRAKDKTFNAEMITHFEPGLPLIKVVPQDIGRVLLNLFTNAFYATQQKAKTADSAYKPVLEVSTWVHQNKFQIRVKDNGVGVPEHVKDKIMQPFFTTKPTGEGTGLGLSLSYDIVVKAHHGNIIINSNEGEGAEFLISLPMDV